MACTSYCTSSRAIRYALDDFGPTPDRDRHAAITTGLRAKEITPFRGQLAPDRKVTCPFNSSEAVRYQQVVVFGARRSPRERSQLKDWEVAEARRRLQDMAQRPESLAVLPDEPDRTYLVPSSAPANWAYRGIPLDAVEGLLPKSGAYRPAARILFAPPSRAQGRPITPLHGGHTGAMRCKRHVERDLRLRRAPAYCRLATG